jgi:hypothetical protein
MNIQIKTGKLYGIVQICLILLFFNSCHNTTAEDAQYVSEINKWHEQRIERLKKPDSWLSLAGLFWLKDGINTIGSAEDNDIIFPTDTPQRIGTVTIQDSVIKFTTEPGVAVMYNDSPVEVIHLKSDADGTPTKLQVGHYQWYVIKRDNRYAIRLKNFNHPNFSTFKGIDRFPVNKKWRVKATFIPYNPPKELSIANVLGSEEKKRCYGALEFEIDGKKFRIDPIGDMDDEEWFIIFGDATNGKTTYGAGRYIYIPKPDENGITYIDFNKAYNPPCVFTKFATCPLPPPQNKLPIEVTAGEKTYGLSSN